MKDIPIIEPKEIITTITNIKTGEQFKNSIKKYTTTKRF